MASSADLVLASGIGGTTLDDIRAGTATSKGQLFHYFPGGKAELVGAIAAIQGERVLDAQRPYLDTLDTWSAWEGWRRAVLDHYGSQAHWGCPVSALAREVVGNVPERAADLAAYMDRWRGYLRAGLERMRMKGILRPEADPEKLALVGFRCAAGWSLADPDHAVPGAARGCVGWCARRPACGGCIVRHRFDSRRPGLPAYARGGAHILPTQPGMWHAGRKTSQWRIVGSRST